MLIVSSERDERFRTRLRQSAVRSALGGSEFHQIARESICPMPVQKSVNVLALHSEMQRVVRQQVKEVVENAALSL